MPSSKASKIRGDQKYYTGVAKEKIGKVIGSQKLAEQGKAEKQAGISERDAASVQNGEKEKHDEGAKEQKDKIVKKSDEIMEQVLKCKFTDCKL
ncbi:7250_t:CDS:2 [Diversispora eburnea]|uniref:7250_t:CDS:1 n=1 Tax=Diversispora eburnea TaxID=1213867 RepID=A0A9N8YN03_9GLOM|nr:7250_t:CDS:2 [Diversispora eburnea]